MSDYESVDYFTDMSLVPDPYPYFDHLRAKCPVQQATPYGVVAVTGHQEALAAYKDPAMSSCVAVAGPFPPLPFTPEGDDISAQIEEHRATIPMAEHVVTMDAAAHQKTRGLLSKLITPKRLSENEDFMWRLVDQRLDKIIGRGACEFTEDFAKPLAMLVIADLLGVPTEDHQEFKTIFGNEPLGEIEGTQGETVAHNPLLFLDEKFTAYISDRRREPRVRRADRTRGGDVSRRIRARCRRSRQAGDVPVRRRHRHDDEVGQHGHAGARRTARHPTGASRQPGPNPSVSRGVSTDGKPRQESFPTGADHDDDR